MLLSTQTEVMSHAVGYEKAIEIIKNAGFDAYDITLIKPLSDKDPLYSCKYKKGAKALREYADSLGIVCNQSHAPFPSSVGDEKKDKEIFESIVKAMEVASILGAKIIVVHPKQHLTYRQNFRELRKMNVEFYKSLIPYCEEFGIKVACENMWQRNPIGKGIVDSTCSRAEEFCDYIDTINNENIVACLDIGHISLTGEDVGHMIRTLGKRIKCLHVHDTDGKTDLHTIPFNAGNDFPMIMKTLKEVGYEGDLTFEADKFITPFPVEMYPDVSRFMERTGRALINIFNG